MEIDEQHSHLPQGWAYSSLGDVCEKPEYGWTTKAVEKEGGLRLLRTTDISKGTIDWSTVPRCAEEPSSPERYKLRAGDIVISRAGSVGVSALIGHGPEAVFASYLIRMRPLDGINRRFVSHFLSSPSYWEQISEQSAGIALQNVNAKKLAAISIPVPPVPEQQRIVAEIEQQLTRLDASASALRRIQTNLKRYRASVLRAACSGELVPAEAELAAPRGGSTSRPVSCWNASRRSVGHAGRRRKSGGASTRSPPYPTRPTSRRCRWGGCGRRSRS